MAVLGSDPGPSARGSPRCRAAEDAAGVGNSPDHDTPPGMISSDAILSPSSPKKNRRFTGLPGKLPVSLLVTTNLPSFCSHANGSLVYWYLAEASTFHCLMATLP